jgi:hypothetical protein
VNYKEYTSLLFLREIIYRVERPNLKNKSMSIDAYMKLDNPLACDVEKPDRKVEISPETLRELQGMERKYKQYVERKANV